MQNLTTNTKICHLLTWNVNGLRDRITDIHAYILQQSPDFIAVQETGPVVCELRGYCQQVLSCDVGSSRGMDKCIKSGLPVSLVEKGVNGGIEYITVCLHLTNDYIYISLICMFILVH